MDRKPGMVWDAETLRVISQLYDEIWASIAHNFAGVEKSSQARSKLAKILLDLAAEGNLEPDHVAFAIASLR